MTGHCRSHYGFTEEELDFIINYDPARSGAGIKYRLGRDAESEED